MREIHENNFPAMQSIRCIIVCILLFLASTVQACSSDNAKDTVLIVSTFPRGKGFQSALVQKARERKETETFRFHPLQTWADAEETNKALAEIGKDRIRSCILLDSRSAFLLSNKLNCQSIYLARSKDMLEKPGEPPLWKKPNAAMVETGPSAESFLEALGMLSPAPKRIGVVYTEKAPGNDDFVRNLKIQCEKVYNSPITLSIHPVSAAACKNSAAMKIFAEKNFNSMEKGSLLLVLPGQNTVKFSFVFRNYAKEHDFGLAALDEIPASGTMLHVGYSDNELAAHCLRLIMKPEKGSPSSAEAAEKRPRVGVRFDPKILKSLGYKMKTDSSSKKNEAKYYYLGSPNPGEKKSVSRRPK